MRRQQERHRLAVFAAGGGVLFALVLLLLGFGACQGLGVGGSGSSTPTPVSTPRPTPAPTPRLTLGPGTSPTPGAGVIAEYEVQEGDVLVDIAAQFGVTAEAIMAANGITDPAQLQVGQVIVIPGNGFQPTPAPTIPPPEARTTGFSYPIAGACLPTDDYRMPNAQREYRAGIHEGVDFYTGDSCVDIPVMTPVMAAKTGKVIRADTKYVAPTAAEMDEMLSRSLANGYTGDEDLDRFRGRQVWIDHGNGVITRYAHLEGVADGIKAGMTVRAGDIIGFTGDTGTPESITDPGVEIHLHFEIWVDGSFLGAGLPPDIVRTLYERAFSDTD